MWSETEFKVTDYDVFNAIGAKIGQMVQEVDPAGRVTDDSELSLSFVVQGRRGGNEEMRFPCTRDALLRMMGDPGTFRFTDPLYRDPKRSFTVYRHKKTGMVHFFDSFPDHSKISNRVLLPADTVTESKGGDRLAQRADIIVEYMAPEGFLEVHQMPFYTQPHQIRQLLVQLRQHNGVVGAGDVLQVQGAAARIVSNDGTKVTLRMAAPGSISAQTGGQLRPGAVM